MTPRFRYLLTARTRRASWFVLVLLLVTMVSASLERVVAQPHDEASRAASDSNQTPFLSLGEHYDVNLNNIAYTSDDGRFFDIYFSCSSVRGEDPLRLNIEGDISQAKSYFHNKKLYGSHFEKYGKYCINRRHIAYTISTGDAVKIFFTARIGDAFVQLTLSGSDAESFRKKSREF